MATTERLAAFAAETPNGAIPDAALDGAALALLDLVGVALAGSTEEVGSIVRGLLPQPRPQDASIWGSGLRASAEDAAFVNAVQSHALDFDDSSSNMRAHPSCTMLPAAMAVGEELGARGEDVLAAYAVGLNVATSLTPALGPGHYLQGWHTTSTIGIFGATAAAGRLRQLDRGQMQVAFGIAASLVSGLSRNFGTMTKPFHPGHAARSAVQATRLAKAGFTADMDILDGKQNALEVHGGPPGGVSVDALDALTVRWELADPGILVKRWPCCYATHRALAGLRDLQGEHGFEADEVRAIRIGFPPGTEGPLKFRAPVTGLQGKFSVEYVLAAFLLDGGVFIDSFTDAQVMRAPAQALIRRVHRFDVPGDRILSSLSGFTDVVVELEGTTLARRIERTPGSFEWPLSLAERMQKFHECAGRALPPEACRRLAEALAEVRALDDVRRLFVASPAAARSAVPAL